MDKSTLLTDHAYRRIAQELVLTPSVHCQNKLVMPDGFIVSAMPVYAPHQASRGVGFRHRCNLTYKMQSLSCRASLLASQIFSTVGLVPIPLYTPSLVALIFDSSYLTLRSLLSFSILHNDIDLTDFFYRRRVCTGAGTGNCRPSLSARKFFFWRGLL